MSDNGKQLDNPKFRDFCAELIRSPMGKQRSL